METYIPLTICETALVLIAKKEAEGLQFIGQLLSRNLKSVQTYLDSKSGEEIKIFKRKKIVLASFKVTSKLINL